MIDCLIVIKRKGNMKIREISTKEIMGVFILFFFVFHFRKDKREQEILYEPRGGGEEEIHPTLAMFSFFFSVCELILTGYCCISRGERNKETKKK